MVTKLEQERKYLIQLPTSWSNLAELFDDMVDVKRIQQTYLVPKPGEQAVRIRKTIEGLGENKKVVYHINQKSPVETGVHKEKEHTISEKQYHQALNNGDPKKCEVEKTRFVFKWHDQTFELDIFKGHLKGLAILELEMDNIDDVVELPNFLKVIKEITDDKQFSNYNLADKKYHSPRD